MPDPGGEAFAYQWTAPLFAPGERVRFAWSSRGALVREGEVRFVETHYDRRTGVAWHLYHIRPDSGRANRTAIEGSVWRAD